MSWEEKGPKIEGIMMALSENLPKLIGKVIDEFYSPENAGKIGRGLAEFYKALREGGVPEDKAVEMVQSYASNLTFKGMRHMCRPMMPWRMMRMGPWMGKWGMHHWREKEEGEEEEPEGEKETE